MQDLITSVVDQFTATRTELIASGNEWTKELSQETLRGTVVDIVESEDLDLSALLTLFVEIAMRKSDFNIQAATDETDIGDLVENLNTLLAAVLEYHLSTHPERLPR